MPVRVRNSFAGLTHFSLIQRVRPANGLQVNLETSLSQSHVETNETEELLSRISAGDVRAWDDLLEQHRAYLQRLLALRIDTRMQSRVDVSDVIQEAHLQATKRMTDYLERRPMPFKLWLRKTACECMLQLRRKHVEAKARAVSREAPLPDHSSVLLADQLVANTTTPSGKFIKQELGERVRDAVGKLSESHREILLMRNYEGLTNLEAAQVLEIEADACRKRYTRALLKLRDVLSADGLSELGL